MRFLGGDRSVTAVDDATGKKVVIDQVIREDGANGKKYDPAVGMTGGLTADRSSSPRQASSGPPGRTGSTRSSR